MVSKSRISPTSITSGSCLSACLNALLKDSVSLPTSLWLTMLFLSLCRYSIGSSIVITCSVLFVFIRSIIAASVVDFPLPVVPVTRINPLCSIEIFLITSGRCNSSIVGILMGITLKTIPMVPLCM